MWVNRLQKRPLCSIRLWRKHVSLLATLDHLSRWKTMMSIVSVSVKNVATAMKSWLACRANPNKTLSLRRGWHIDRAFLKRGSLPAWGGASGEDALIGANFLVMFHSNCWSVLLSFWDMTMGQTADRPTSATNTYLAVKVGQQQSDIP